MLITPLYAGLLALWFLVLSFRVVAKRSKIFIGDGGDPDMLRRIRGHANFAEYVPLILLMLGMLELSRYPAWLLHALGIALLISRLLHGYTFGFSEQFKFGRMVGALLTFIVLLLAGCLCVYQGWLGFSLMHAVAG